MLQLYLLEIFIEDIHFAKNFSPYPKPNDLIVSATVNNLLSFDIQIAEFSDSSDNDKPSASINFNCGKSCLFANNPQDLIEIFEKNPLVFLITTIGKCIAVNKINWDNKFLETIKKTIKNPTGQPPVIVRDKFALKSEQTSSKIGDIAVQIRLICFGEQVQSNYRASKTGTVLIKSQQDSIIFECQRIEDSPITGGIPPVTPFYYPDTGTITPQTKSGASPEAPNLASAQVPTVTMTQGSTSTTIPQVPGSVLGSAAGPVLVTTEGQVLGSGAGPLLGVGAGPVLGSGSGQVLDTGARPVIGSGADPLLASGTGQVLGPGTGQVLGPGTRQVLGSGVGPVLGSGAGTALSSGPGTPLRSRAGSILNSPPGTVLGSPAGTVLGSPAGTILGSATGPIPITPSPPTLLGSATGPIPITPSPPTLTRPSILDSGLLPTPSPPAITQPPMLGSGLLPTTGGPDFSTISLLSDQYVRQFGAFASVGTFDVMSIVQRPDENKFINLKFLQEYNGYTDDFMSLNQSVDDNGKLTIERINQSLCKNRNCPAAIKFKEYGIGPLANGSGLGTITTPVKVPTKYGISNTYGTFGYYGPYGLLSKPDENQKEKDDKSTKPLRLTGGGSINYQTIRNPSVECRDVMQQFDTILDNFRKSLSPCGQSNCPQSQNMLQNWKSNDLPPVFPDKCNQPLPCSMVKALPPIHWDCPEPLPEGVCKNPECPYLPDDIKQLNRCCMDANRAKRESPKSCATESADGCTDSTCPIPLTCKNSKCPFQYPEIISKIPPELHKYLVCENPSCPHLAKCKEELLSEDTIDDKKPKKTPYRSDVDADDNPSPETEYTSDTRIDTNQSPCERNQCCGKCANKPDEPAIPEKVVEKKTKKRQKKQRFDYTIGNKYPGVRYGHSHCKATGSAVPPNQGWMWNLYPRKGWRPGVIQKTIASRIKQHWEKKGIPMLRIKQFQRGDVQSDDEQINIEQKPTLQIQRRDGYYYITLHPLKDPHTVDPNEDPYMNCTPLQFKIIDKKKTDENNDNKDDSSSDSDLDIEFTSPAGLVPPDRLKKLKNIVHSDTQYDQRDFTPSTKDKKKKKDKKGKKDKKKKK